MGRVWPRHSHRGSPLNSIVRHHINGNSNSVAHGNRCYCGWIGRGRMHAGVGGRWLIHADPEPIQAQLPALFQAEGFDEFVHAPSANKFRTFRKIANPDIYAIVQRNDVGIQIDFRETWDLSSDGASSFSSIEQRLRTAFGAERVVTVEVPQRRGR